LSFAFKPLTIHTAHELLRKKQASAVELAQAYLERVHSTEPNVHAFITVTDKLALEQAARADKLIAEGKAGPLTGVPG